MAQGDQLPAVAVVASGHETQPPARYTEASLVKELEARGIGRPSTYASVISTIQDRGYVWRKGTALVPAWTSFAVVNLLDPDVIVLGGGMSNVPGVPEAAQAGLGANIFSATGNSHDAPPATRVVRAVHGDSSGVRGAAWLWPAGER